MQKNEIWLSRFKALKWYTGNVWVKQVYSIPKYNAKPSFLYKQIFVCLNIHRAIKIFVLWKWKPKIPKPIKFIKINCEANKNNSASIQAFFKNSIVCTYKGRLSWKHFAGWISHRCKPCITTWILNQGNKSGYWALDL